MPRILLPAFLLFVLLLGGLASFNPGWLELAVPLLVYLLAALLFSPGRLDLSAERILSDERIAPGQLVKVELLVTNHGPALRELILSDILPENSTVMSGSARRVVSIKKGETLHWTYTFSGKRGFHAFSQVQASASDLFGLTTIRQSLATRGQVLVLPAAPRVRRLTIRTRSTRVYSGTIPARQGGPGVDFFGVREYQPGDPLHAINWQVSARHPQALYANEYEQERVADVGIILDARRQVNQLGENLSIFDESILAATSLSEAFLSSGNRVGLLIYGQYINWTLPGYGKQQRERILHALARAVPGDSQAFTGVHIPRSLFPVNSQLVFISPLIADDVQPLVNLRALGYALIVICPDAVRFELAYLPENESVRQASRILALRRKLTLQRLQHAGCQVVNWDVSHPFEQAAETALSRPPAFIRAIGAGNTRR
ncbi:MAG TPA: DUF58 domain-containing protein [Anaerolineales bacterium]|jgi:uncharacterized protein (DUF58 family)